MQGGRAPVGTQLEAGLEARCLSCHIAGWLAGRLQVPVDEMIGSERQGDFGRGLGRQAKDCKPVFVIEPEQCLFDLETRELETQTKTTFKTPTNFAAGFGSGKIYVRARRPLVLQKASAPEEQLAKRSQKTSGPARPCARGAKRRCDPSLPHTREAPADVATGCPNGYGCMCVHMYLPS